jgi:diadenosine tetraphosphate (Ap4A) HIT family hydrolase
MVWQLDPKIDADTYHVMDYPGLVVLLMDDARYPWFVIVPKKDEVTELIDLNENEKDQIYKYIDLISNFLKLKYIDATINVAKIGNIVKQLHIHIVARNENDLTWPNPVWGIGQSQKYKKNDAKIIIEELKQYFTENYPHKD